MKNIGRALVVTAATVLTVPAHAVFKCVDEKGKTFIGETPPEQCAKVVMYETTSSGRILRTIQPPLTEDQLKAKAEAAEKQKEADKAAFEQRRKDLALLASFSSAEEFDVSLNRNIEPIAGRIKSANDRMAAIDKRNKELDDELEFYKAGKSKDAKAAAKEAKDSGKRHAPEAPPLLTDEKARLAHEKTVLTRNVASYEKEIAELKRKFETDKKRWVALKSGKNDAPETRTADAKPEEVKAAAPKADAKPVTKSY